MMRTATRLVAAALIGFLGFAEYAQAAEGNWLVRARALYMITDNDNSRTPVTEALGEVKAENKIFPEIDVTWFMTPNIAAELILTYPQKHDVKVGGTDIGSLKHLPPTLLLQYHFNPGGTLRPYAGAGVNYTRFSSVKLNAEPATGVDTPLDVSSSSFGLALQAGVDIQLAPQWYLNFDAKYVKIDTNVTVDGGALDGTRVTKLGLDPWLLSVGIGYRF